MFGPGFKLTLTHQPQACSISHLTNTFSISTDVLMRNLSLKKTLTNKCTFKHFTLVKPFTLVHTCVLQKWDKLMHVCVHIRTRGLEMLVLRKLRFCCRKWLHTSNKITSTRRYFILVKWRCFAVFWNLTLSLMSFSSFTVFHDSPSLLYATLKTDTNCTTPKSLAPWVMIPLMRFVFSRSTWEQHKLKPQSF